MTENDIRGVVAALQEALANDDEEIGRPLIFQLLAQALVDLNRLATSAEELLVRNQ